MDNLATYVINLDRCPERLASTEDRLNKIGLNFQRIPAIDGSNLPQELGEKSRPTMGRALSVGEVGCFQSHRLAAQSFLESDYELGLVLEDDVDITDQTRSCLDAFSKNWSKISIWDVANLSRPAKHYQTEVRAAVWPNKPRPFWAHYFPVTTTALLWTRGGARAFLTMSDTMEYPVDVQLQRWIATTNRGLAFEEPPMPARREEASTIQNLRKSVKSRQSGETKLRLKRLAQTHFDGVKNLCLTRGLLK